MEHEHNRTNTQVTRIESGILLVRGRRVIIDVDLALLYGVPTKALNQAVKRNARRFPSDFVFQLTAAEKEEVVTNCDHLIKLKFSKSLPFAFAEHGAIQAANVLNSEQAMEIQLKQIFDAIRELMAAPEPATKRPIGFVTPADGPAKPKASKTRLR